ncbi:MAG: hypothetical protein OXH20_09685 [bacterium]|nr:hypothetical protein [bacterium]
MGAGEFDSNASNVPRRCTAQLPVRHDGGARGCPRGEMWPVRRMGEEIRLPVTTDANAVTAVDNVRRSLVLLGALLFPLSDERAALEAGDSVGYVDAIAARMRGICGQSAAIIDNALTALADPVDAKKSSRRRTKVPSLARLADGVRDEVEAIFAQCGLPDAPRCLQEGRFPGPEPDAGLAVVVPLAARLAAASIRLAAVAAGNIEVAPGDAGRSRAEAVANGTGRTARRIAMVIDDWDMLASSPEAIIGCPPRPGTRAGDATPPPDRSSNGPRSLGVADALGGAGKLSSGRSTARRQRTQPVWSAGGAIQRD